jgi:alpha-methylacyl-CoA racemase
MSGPLSGVRVLELPAIGPAPFCGALLADMGADVVRIDRTKSIDLGTPFPRQFDFYNRNKRSVALDLKSPAAIEMAMRLVRRSDILLEGFRPGAAERLGLGPVECLEANPRLVYGRVTGWGQDGSLANAAGHDVNYIALNGALHSIGEKGRAPAVPLNLVADLGGGAMYLAVGVLAALTEARVSGRGQVVDAAMVDGVANLMSAFLALRQMGEWTLDRADNVADGGSPFYRTYETSDGKYIAVGAIEGRFYEQLVSGLGLDIAQLPRQNDRATWPGVSARFAEIFRSRTRDEWVATMRGRDACFSPVLNMDEAPMHPHMRERAVFSEFDGALHPSPAPRFGRTPGSLRLPPPAPGQHSSEVLAEYGVSSAEIDALERAGAMLQTKP